MNVLITGHSGFLGQHLVEKFTFKGHNVIGVSRSQGPGHYQYSMDIISDSKKFISLVREKSIDIIIHTAGKPIVSDCNDNPYDAIESNGLGTTVVLEAARLANVKKCIMLETDKVYGEQRMIPTKEDAELNPDSPYEFSKCIAFLNNEFYREHYDMDVISVRPANLFGPGDKTVGRLVPSAMRCIHEYRPLRVYHHARSMERDFIFVRDVAEMIYLLATKDCEHSVYNLSSNNSMTIDEAARSICDILDYEPGVEYPRQEDSFPEISKQAIDGSRFIKEFEFNFTPWDEAILYTYEHQ